jgi:hypothetical protein
MWSIWPSYQRPLLLSKISRNTKSEKERCTFRRVVDSARVSLHEKRSYPTFTYTGKHLADYSHKLSIIFKQSRIMHKELRYQVKTHAISNMPREKIILMMPIKKYSRSTCFFCLPQKVPTMLSQENREHNKLVPRLHSKHTNITSKCASNQT